MLAGAGNKVEPRVIVTDEAVGDQWLVSTGIATGDRVIVKGLQWVRPGMEVKPVPRQCRSGVRCSAFHRALIFSTDWNLDL